MPLDVQPLSRTRQAVMLLVMLLLLAGSLGFAQFLVKRQHPTVIVTADFLPPPGVKAFPVNKSAELAFSGPLKKITLQSGTETRTFVAYSFDGNWDKPMPWNTCLEHLFANMTGNDTPNPGIPITATLNGYTAFERRNVVTAPIPHFELLRMTMLRDHVIAFGFSGTGLLTETDMTYFDDYCARNVQISTQHIQP